MGNVGSGGSAQHGAASHAAILREGPFTQRPPIFVLTSGGRKKENYNKDNSEHLVDKPMDHMTRKLIKKNTVDLRNDRQAPLPELLTLGQAQQILGMKRSSIYRAMKRRELNWVGGIRRRRFEHEELVRYITVNRVGAA